jgi:hypothetical protein
MQWHRDDQEAYQKWKESIEHVRKLTKANLTLAQARHKAQYDKTAREKHVTVGQTVFIRIHRPTFSASHKLSPYFSGPYTITKQIGPLNYKVMNPKGQVLPRTYKLCDFKTVPLTPRLDKYAELSSKIADQEKFPILVPTMDDSGRTTPVEEGDPDSFRLRHENKIRKRQLRELKKLANEPIPDSESVEMDDRPRRHYPVTKYPSLDSRDETNRLIRQLHKQVVHPDGPEELGVDPDPQYASEEPLVDPEPVPVNTVPVARDLAPDEMLRPVQKVHARRHNPDQSIDYLVTFSGFPAKSSREYISELNFEPEDRQALSQRKLRTVGQQNLTHVNVTQPEPAHGLTKFINRCVAAIMRHQEELTTEEVEMLLNSQVKKPAMSRPTP